MIIKMKLRRHWYSGPGASLCISALRKKVSLPEKQQTIYAVFFRERVADSFRIKRPRALHYMDASTVAGFSGDLMSSAMWKLAEAYNNGFRYVRIEY